MKKRRWLAAGMAAVMVAGMLAGCGSSSDSGDSAGDTAETTTAAAVQAPTEEASGEEVTLRVALWDYSNTQYYKTIHMIDLRYYRMGVAGYAEAIGADAIFICYSVNNFQSDSNMIYLGQ